MNQERSASNFSYDEFILTQKEEKNQREVIHFLSWYGVLISVSYGFLFLILSFHLLMFKTFFLAFLYLGVFVLNNRSMVPVRPLSVMAMFIALIHTSTLGLVFLPPSTGLHLWGLIIPFFCIITIDQRDIMWSVLFSTVAGVVLVFLEWNKFSYTPPLQVEILEELMPFIRAFTIFTIVLFVSGIFWFYHRNLDKARQALQSSYERSESLLLNIFPTSIANRLKQKTGIIADDVTEASVLFCDLVGFTNIASQQTALQTVQMLNGVFVAFDEAIEARGLEKIKTIGDAYMVASGVPRQRADHASALIHLALDFLQIVDRFNAQNSHNLSLRIGINCGPMTAGVIGKRKFSYDLWGDTVNVASRMESTGIPNRIQVTQSLVDATKGAFQFEPREKIQIKGKGEMQTFLYVRKVAAA